MKAPHASGMGEQGHDQSVLAPSRLVHTAPNRSNIPAVIEISQWDFFSHLFGQQEGWIETRSINAQTVVPDWRHWPASEESFRPIVVNPKLNGYYGVALRSDKRTKEYQRTDLIWLDCDVKDLAEDRKAEGERLKQLPPDELMAYVASVYKRFMDECCTLGLQLVYVMFSGHGLQGAFRAPRLLEHDETKAAIKGVAALFKEFGADSAVADLGRVLRLPDTYNVKNSDRPIKAELWHLSDARLTEEKVAELIEKGRAGKATTKASGKAEREQKPAQHDGRLLAWANTRTNLREYLLSTRKYTGDPTSERLSSVYGDSRNNVVYGTNGKGYECVSLKSSSHPAYQHQKEQGIDNPSMDFVDALTFHEYVEKRGMNWDEAHKAVYQHLAQEQEVEALGRKVAETDLPDASQIPAPEDFVKGKPHYSDDQMLALLDYPLELGSPFGDLANGYRTAQSSDGNLRHGETSSLYKVYLLEKHVWVSLKEDNPQAIAYASKLPALLEKESDYIVQCAVALQKAGRIEDSEAMLRQINKYRRAKEQVARHTVRKSALLDARQFISIDDALFNPKPFRIGCANCAYIEGTTREILREDYFTDLLPVEYYPDADRSDCYEVLDRMTGGNRKLRDDLQYAVGYALSGLSNQRHIFAFYGPPATGKSIFVNSIAAIMGSLAVVVDPKHISTKTDRERAGQVIKNKRLAIVNEVGGTVRLQAEILKTLSGGDMLPSRSLFSESETTRPTHTLFLVSNDPINVDTTDDALWERIKSIPFVHPLAPDGKEDLLGGRRLQDVIYDPQSSYLRGFLAWAVEGLERVRNGELFSPSETIRNATKELREESDRYRDFWLTHDFGESLGEMPVMERLQEGVKASWLMFQLEEWCKANAVPVPQGPALKHVYEAVGLVNRRSAKKWILEYPERFPQ